jgi:mono/diheme cytochrome c family protein
MKVCLIAFALLAPFLLAGCSNSGSSNVNKAPVAGTSRAAATPDEFVFARANWATDCSGCHGDQGKGGLVKIPDGTKLKVPSLLEGHALKHIDEDYVDQIENGGDGMPKFKDKLTPEEIQTLVKFIRHEIQGRP